MKIYLDDVRATPEGWVRTYTVEETQALLLEHRGNITNMSLDHDLGLEPSCQTCVDSPKCDIDIGDINTDCSCACHKVRATGYDLVKWCAEHDIWSTCKPTVHSANPVGYKNMVAIIERYWHPPEE